MHGTFVLSDDSHGIAQVALNYPRMLRAIKAAGIQEVQYLKRTGRTELDPRFPGVQAISVLVTSLEGHQVFRES